MFILKENGLEFEFDSQIGVKNEDGFYESEINGAVPVPILLNTDRIILPIDEGVVLNADGDYENGEIGYDFNNLSYIFCSREGTLSMIVIERDKKYLMITLESGLYSRYSLKKENGLYTLSIYNQKPCKVFYKVFENIVTLCREYKLVKKIDAVTLKQKAAENPLVNNLFGGAIFWIWNDNYDEIMYSDYECNENPQTGEKLLEIAGELKSEGVDKALFSIFFEGDSKYVEDLYKKYGYISTQYDNYSDVLNPELLSVIPNNRVKNCDYTARRMKDYPDGISVDKNGNFLGAWQLKGFDGKMHSQNHLCPLVGMERMRDEVAETVKKYPYYKGRFIDCYGGKAAETCFSPKHPINSFEECLKIKKTAFNNLKKMGLIAGTEDGFEDLADELIYTEGLHSPVVFRNENAGRRHKNMYNETEERHIDKHMLDPKCRIPLWEMVYHENLLAFPYWGDSTDDSVKQIKKKVLFACLFGCQPLYSFSLSNYKTLKPFIISSYKRIAEVSKYTITEPITDYKILSEDYTLQQTVFGGRYSVTVNFSEKEQTAGGKIIPPEDLVFEILK